MRFSAISTACAMAVLAAGCGPSGGPSDSSAGPDREIAYPETRTVDQTDDYFGETVADPYRWLEADVRDSGEVADWVAAENAVTNAYLDALPARHDIAQRMRDIWNFDVFYTPKKAGDRLFFRQLPPGVDQPVLYAQLGLRGQRVQVLNPNAWSDDGSVAMAEYYPSPDGQHVAYAIQEGGSDWRTVKVTPTDDEAADTLEWVKFSEIAWAPDGSGFFYSRYPEPEGEAFQDLNYGHQIYFHSLGAPQDRDVLVYERPDDPELNLTAEVSDDGEWLVITATRGTDARHEIVLWSLTDEDAETFVLIPGFENDFTLIGGDGEKLYFRTDLDAPKGRIVAVTPDPASPGAPEFEEIVPQARHVLTEAHLVGEDLVAHYLADAKSMLYLFDREGEALNELGLPAVGSVTGIDSRYGDPVLFLTFESFIQPPTVLALDVEAGQSLTFLAPELPFDPADFVVEQTFVTSTDGTQIPIFAAYRADITPINERQTLLYGYGGFNISYVPKFSPMFMTWMDMGGVFVQANIRGGGEYGAEWHDAGRLANKQNVFDDFIAVSEELIDSRVTTPEKLAIHGRSNGGLLIGAVVNQRPDLFAAALPTVGVMDMLRFNQFTAGRFWTDDYGDPGVEADYRVLRAYSPYHNIDPAADYPPILATTADTDDRVVPGHTFKYIARLQAAQGGMAAEGEAPRLVRIDTSAGHGSGKPKSQYIAEYSDQLAFAAYNTGLEILPPAIEAPDLPADPDAPVSVNAGGMNMTPDPRADGE